MIEDGFKYKFWLQCLCSSSRILMFVTEYRIARCDAVYLSTLDSNSKKMKIYLRRIERKAINNNNNNIIDRDDDEREKK